MLPQPPQLRKLFNYYTLTALCMIGLIYHFHVVQDHLAARVPEVPAIIPRNPNGIPKLLWYKLGPKGLSEEARNWTDSCIKGNPEYQPHFMTDESGDEYVRKTFSFRPDIVNTYLAFPIPIYKADMLRYLLLWDQGGVWSDLDVSCEGVPMDEWVPPKFQGKASLVVGWEFDAGHDEPYMRQFCSWTFMAKPRLPHMMQVVDDILAEVRAKTLKYNVPVENITLEMMGDVVDFTGPRRLTTGTFRSLAKRLNRTLDITETYKILEPRLYEDVLILPGHSFSALTNRYTPEEKSVLPPQLVTHHYSGSWKNDKGGESKRRR